MTRRSGRPPRGPGGGGGGGYGAAAAGAAGRLAELVGDALPRPGGRWAGAPLGALPAALGGGVAAAAAAMARHTGAAAIGMPTARPTVAAVRPGEPGRG